MKTMDELLLGYLDDSLTEAEQHELDQALGRDPGIARRLAEFSLQEIQLREMGGVGKCAPLFAGESHPAPGRPILRFVLPLAAAAALVMAVGGVWWVISQQSAVSSEQLAVSSQQLAANS